VLWTEQSTVDRRHRENACLRIEVRVLFSSSNVGMQKVYIPRIMHWTSRTFRQEHHAKNPGMRIIAASKSMESFAPWSSGAEQRTMSDREMRILLAFEHRCEQAEKPSGYITHCLQKPVCNERVIG